MNLKPILIKSNFAQNIVHIAKMAEQPCHRMWHDLKSTEITVIENMNRFTYAKFAASSSNLAA